MEKNKGTEKFPVEIAQILGQKFAGLEIGKVSLKENDFEESCKLICESALKEFGGEKIPFFVGGDHSITYPLVEAFSEKFDGEIGLIVFDAHVDCSMDFLPASHEDIIRGIVGKGFVKAENVLILGVRKIFEVEEEFLKGEGKEIGVVRAEEIKKELGRVKGLVQDFVLNKSAVYVSVDIDVFDPSIAPGTGYLEENGLGEGEFFELFGMVLESGKVFGADLVEVNSEKDVDGKTEKLAVKILEKTADMV